MGCCSSSEGAQGTQGGNAGARPPDRPTPTAPPQQKIAANEEVKPMTEPATSSNITGGGGLLSTIITTVIGGASLTNSGNASCGRYPDKFRRILNLIKDYPLLDYEDYNKTVEDDEIAPLDINLDYWEIGRDGIRMLVAALEEANKKSDNGEDYELITTVKTDAATGTTTTTVTSTKCRKIRKLSLDHNEIGSQGVEELIILLCQHTNTWIIEELDLGHNDIGDEGAISIARLLKSSTLAGQSIQKLALDYNGIGDDGMIEIAHALRSNNNASLHSIDLADNDIADEGCHAMEVSLSSNVALRELRLNGNLQISAEMEVRVKERIQRNSVKYQHEEYVKEEGIMYYMNYSELMIEREEGMLREESGGGPGMFTRMTSTVRGIIPVGGNEATYVGDDDVDANTKHVRSEKQRKKDDDMDYRCGGVTLSWNTQKIMEATAFDGAAFSALLFALKDVIQQCDDEESTTDEGNIPKLPTKYAKQLRKPLVRKMLVNQKIILERSASLSDRMIDTNDVNDENDSGDTTTILHLTVAAEAPCAVELSRLLVEHFNANLDEVKDGAGRTARTIAVANRNTSMIKWARSVGTIAGRYRRLPGPPAHESATCTVFFAVDEFTKEGSIKDVHGGERDVALKEMKNESHFKKELLMRLTRVPDNLNECDDLTELNRFDTRHVLPILRAHELEVKSSKRLILVMPRGERNLLQAVSDERMSRDPEKIVYFVQDIVPAVIHLHNDHNIIHCDLKPRNFVRIQGDWKLIDFDASVNMGDMPGNDKFSGGYVPPELAKALFHPSKNRYELQKDLNVRKAQLKHAMSKMDLSTMQTVLTDIEIIKDKMKQIDEGKTKNDLSADPTFDVWSFGIVLYLLLTGSDLFSLNVGDDQLTDEKEQTRLVRWDGLKEEHLGRILSYWNTNDDEVGAAKDLLTRCLHPDPNFRISSMQHVLNHPFFTRHVNSSRSIEELQCIKDEIVDAVGQKIDNTIRATLSIRDATLPSLWVLLPSKRTGRMSCMYENFSLYGKYKLYMICQITGRCRHEPINLFFMKTRAKNALIQAAPLIAGTILLLKAGLCAGKVAGIPLPSSLPFLDDLHDHMTNTDVFALDDLNRLTEHFESLKTEAEYEVEKSNLVDQLTRTQEQNRKAGLETCDQLRRLLKAGQSVQYTDEEVAAFARLQRMVHPDGSCIWVDRSENAKTKAKEYGYIESEMNMTNFDVDIALDEEEEERGKGTEFFHKEEMVASGVSAPGPIASERGDDNNLLRAQDNLGTAPPVTTKDLCDDISSQKDQIENEEEPPETSGISLREIFEEQEFYSAKNVFDESKYDNQSEIKVDGERDSIYRSRLKKRSQEEQFYSSLKMTSSEQDDVSIENKQV